MSNQMSESVIVGHGMRGSPAGKWGPKVMKDFVGDNENLERTLVTDQNACRMGVTCLEPDSEPGAALCTNWNFWVVLRGRSHKVHWTTQHVSRWPDQPIQGQEPSCRLNETGSMPLRHLPELVSLAITPYADSRIPSTKGKDSVLWDIRLPNHLAADPKPPDKC